MGIKDINKKYELNEIVKGDAIFCATAITDTMTLKGIIEESKNSYLSETLITFKNLNTRNTDIVKKKFIFDNL